MDTTTHLAAWREVEPRPYRAQLLHVLALARADEHGAWTPATKVGLRRALTHRGEDECTHRQVVTAIAHGVGQGFLRSDSTPDRIVLAGATAPTHTPTEETR